jgi:hypothetical protein
VLSGPSNDELQRTSDGTAAGSPLNSVLGRPNEERRVRRKLTAVGSLLLVLAACTRTLSDADLLSYASSSFDQRAMEGKSVVLGVHQGVSVVAEFPCADLCPNNTVRVIHYDVAGETECAQKGGLPRTLWVPEGVGNVPRIYCLPRVIAAEVDKQETWKRGAAQQ